MKYEFKCKNCGNKSTVDIPMQEVASTKITCKQCSKPMVRVWKASLVVPDYMKADQSQEMSYVNERLNIRPSGKTRVYY